MSKIIFDWMRGASERSKSGWEKRFEQAFERGEKLGPKGEAYISRTYGPEVGRGGGGVGGGDYLDYEDYDQWDDWEDPEWSY